MGIEEQVVAKMRADWAVVAKDRRDSGDWSESDEADILAAIKAAIDSHDKASIACWSRWLADLSSWVTAWNLICRGSEAAMRAAAREHKANGNQEKGKQ